MLTYEHEHKSCKSEFRVQHALHFESNFSRRPAVLYISVVMCLSGGVKSAHKWMNATCRCTHMQHAYWHTYTDTYWDVQREAVCEDKEAVLETGAHYSGNSLPWELIKVTQIVWLWNSASFVLHIQDKQVKKKKLKASLANCKIQKHEGTATGVPRLRLNCRCRQYVFIMRCQRTIITVKASHWSVWLQG